MSIHFTGMTRHEERSVEVNAYTQFTRPDCPPRPMRKRMNESEGHSSRSRGSALQGLPDPYLPRSRSARKFGRPRRWATAGSP